MREMKLRLALGFAAFCLGLPAFAEGLYGAIAFSPSSGRSGSSWNFQTPAQAEVEANIHCALGDCYTAVVFQACGAIAVGDGYGMGFATDQVPGKAMDAALVSCSQYTTNCQITESFCNEGF